MGDYQTETFSVCWKRNKNYWHDVSVHKLLDIYIYKSLPLVKFFSIFQNYHSLSLSLSNVLINISFGIEPCCHTENVILSSWIVNGKTLGQKYNCWIYKLHAGIERPYTRIINYYYYIRLLIWNKWKWDK